MIKAQKPCRFPKSDNKEIANRPCHKGGFERGRNWVSNELGYTATTFKTISDVPPKRGIAKKPNLPTMIKAQKPYRLPKSDNKTLEMVQEPEKASGTGDIDWDVEIDFSDGLQARNPLALPKSNNKKWAAMMECSLGEEMDEKLDSRLQLPIALPDGGEVAGAVALSSIESGKSLSEFGVRREDVVKSLENIYNPGFHTPSSLALKLLEVLETLSHQDRPSDFGNLLSERRLTLEDCVRQDKLPDLSGTLQINTVEEIVTQSPRSFGGLTAELASSSHWPIDLPDGQQILQLDSLELITNAAARGARADQSYPVESCSEKKMMRETIKRKCRTMSGISLENLQQNLDSKCEDAVKSLGVKRVCRQRGMYRESKVKHIHRQHGIHRWPFQQKWASMKGSSLGEERSFENSGLCVDEKLYSRLRTIPTPQLARYLPPPISLLDGGNTAGPIALSLREIGGRLADAEKSLSDIYDPGFQTPDSLARKSLEALETLSRQEQPSDIIYSLSEGRLTLKGCARQGKLLDPLLGTLQIYAVEERVTHLPRSLGGLTPQSASSSHWPIGSPDGQQIVQLDSLEQSRDNVVQGTRADQKCPTISLAEKKIFRQTLKRKWRTTSVICLEDLQQHYGSRCENTAKSNCVSISAVKRIYTPLGIHRVSTMKRIHRQHGIHRWPSRLSASTSHWPISLPYGGQIMQLNSVERSRNSVAHGARVDQSCPTASLSEKKMVRALKRRGRTKSVISLDELQQHFGSRCEDAVKCLFVSVSTVKRICWQHGIHRASTVKRICRQHCFHRWPFRQKWATMKGCYLGEERSVEVISLSTDGKRDSRLQFIHISQLSRSSPWPIALPDGGEIVGPIALSSSDFASTNNKARLVREDQRGSTASHSEKKNTREASNSGGISTSLFSLEDLQRLFGRKREDAAKSLDVSVSTFKRICRHHGIKRWPNRIRNNVWKPPDPQGEKNVSPTCKTLSTNGQTETGYEMDGHLQEPNEFPRDSIGGPNCWNMGNGSLEDIIRTHTFHDSCPDNYLDIGSSIPPMFKESGEARGSYECAFQLRDQSTVPPTCKTLSANRQTAMENEGVGQHQVPNEFPPDSIGGPNSWHSENGLLEDVARTPTLHDSYTHDSYIDNYPDMIPPHIPPIFKERGEAGGSSEWGLQWRDLTYTNPDTLEFPLPRMASTLMVSESMRISEDCRHPQMASTQMVSVSMGISEDWRQPTIASTQMVSENMEISQDWRNLLASPTEAFQEVNVSGSSNWTVPTSFDPSLSQPTRSIPHTMPIIPSMLPMSPCIMPTITHMTSHLTTGEDVSCVTLKPRYGRTIMNFQFPPRSGITELKEEVSKRLELVLGSFNIEYTDEDGDDVLIGCDEDFRRCLQRFSPLGTQAIRLLVIDKDPIATNICESCGSLKRKRP